MYCYTMVVLRNLLLEGVENRSITLDVFYNEDGKKKPIVIFCHGFKGFKDWGHFDLIGEAFANAGMFFLKFNFSKNGVTPDNLLEFVDLEAFGHNSYTDELYDLKKVVEFIVEKGTDLDVNEMDASNITLIGHSKGGGGAILGATENPEISRLITWAAVAKYGRMFEDREHLEQWRKNGVVYVYNGRTNQQMPMYYSQYESYAQEKRRLDIPQKATELKIPWLIVHGDADKAVLYSEAEELHRLNPNSQLLTIKNGDHTFGGKHPWLESQLPSDCQKVVDASIQFIKSN